MVMPSDKEYKIAKKIKLGKASINSDFEELAVYIENTYGIRPLNIIYDTIYKRPRLMICLELVKDLGAFKDGNGNIDTGKQKDIADKFRVISKSSVFKRGLLSLWSWASSIYTSDIFVYFTAFEPIAKIEVNERVSKSDIESVQQAINNNDIWLISPAFSGVTFFVYTDEQLHQYEDSKEKQKWADAYFDVLERYDEFGYFKRDMFGVSVDSKQNFDENYSSNWYYYYK